MHVVPFGDEECAARVSPGLHIVYTLDEVDFVQNLIFYIEQSYMIPVSSVRPARAAHRNDD